MVIILNGNGKNIDFAGPIEMTGKEREKFVSFLRTLFHTVKEEEVASFRPERLGNKAFSKEWETEEYEVLLDLEKNNEEVSRMLGRTWMSVEMRRIPYIDEMMSFAKKKGVDLFKASKSEMKKLIEEYIKEHEEELVRRKEERTEERKEIKEAKELVEGFSKREDELKFLVSVGKAKKEALEALKKEKKEAEIKLKELVKE